MQYRRRDIAHVVEAINFNELVQHGLKNTTNIVRGMPWSFQYEGRQVTHENDECYLIGNDAIRMMSDDMLVIDDDEMFACKKSVFRTIYKPLNTRKLTGHKVNGCNESLEIGVLDEPGHGGACHNYVIYCPHDAFNEELNASLCTYIQFQNGPLKEAGVNGITHETLLAILIDRLDGFQSGKYACDDNQEAVNALRKAQEALLRRTKARVVRGVEGTHEK